MKKVADPAVLHDERQGAEALESPAGEKRPAESGSACHRRSTRLPIAIPVLLQGEDAAGDPFIEKGFTLFVSKHGAEITAPLALVVGSEILLENRAMKRSARCRVVWSRGLRSVNTLFSAGVDFLEPGNFWGIKFPPQDWESDASAPAAAKPAETPKPAREAPSAGAPPPPVARPAEPPPASPQDAPDTAVEAAAPSLEAPSASAEIPPPESVQPTEPPSSEAPAESPPPAEAAGQPECPPPPGPAEQKPEAENSAGQERAGADSSAQGHALVERLEALRADLEVLIARGEQVRAGQEAEIRKSLERTADCLAARLSDSFKEYAESAAGAREAILREDLGRSQEEIRKQLLEAGEKVRLSWEERGRSAEAEVARRADAALDALQRAAEEAAARLGAEAARLTAEVSHWGEDHRAKAAGISASLQEGFRNYLEVQVNGWKNEVCETAKGHQDAAAREFTARVRKAAEEARESAALELRRQAEDARRLLGEELRASASAAAAAARASVNELRSSAGTLAAEAEARLSAISQRAVETLRAEAARPPDAWRPGAETLFRELTDAKAREFDARLHNVFEARERSAHGELEEHARQSKEQAMAEVRRAAGQAVKEIAAAAQQQIGLAAVLLKDFSDRATARLEADSGKWAADIERQQAGASRSALDRMRSEAEAFAGAFRQRLLQAAHTLEPPAKDSTP